ncbi:MAG: hypothetical protein KF690_11900 [Bacteroidetes bacterium]|nr:hypothetical protein [Bacteroidota bacterium]
MLPPILLSHRLWMTAGLVLAVAGCCPNRRLYQHVYERVVKDTVVITPGVQLQQVFSCGDTLQIDTGQLRLRLVPAPVSPADAVDHPLRYNLQATCVPETLHVPRVVRETIRVNAPAAPARNAFFHWTGVAFWGLLFLSLLLFFLIQLKR